MLTILRAVICIQIFQIIRSPCVRSINVSGLKITDAVQVSADKLELVGNIGRDTLSCLGYEKFLHAQHPDIGLKVDQIIRKYGYPVETHVVESPDGYFLTVFRIPHSPKSPSVSGEKKKAVLLSHVFMGSSQTFLYQHGSRNLAFFLADNGFDVFLENCRGSTYSPHHKRFTPLEESYWDFSFHEMGYYDIPAITDKILNITGNEKIFYVGHSMGTTKFLVAASSRRKFNDKIHAAFLLAPSAFIGKSTSILKLIAKGAAQLNVQNNAFNDNPAINGRVDGMARFRELSGLSIGTVCDLTSAINCIVCSNVEFAIFGYNPAQTNYTLIPLRWSTYPNQFSTKTLLHFGQLMDTGSFRQYDYGSISDNHYVYGKDSPPNYNLTKVRAPMHLYYSKNDQLCVPEDVEYTTTQFREGVLKSKTLISDPLFTHLDFSFAIDADLLVYKNIVQEMLNYDK